MATNFLLYNLNKPLKPRCVETLLNYKYNDEALKANFVSGGGGGGGGGGGESNRCSN